MKLNAIITGVTGMVGEGVLHECLLHPEVESILVIGRRTCGVQHEKVKEFLLPDLFDLSGIEAQLAGFNACFFCMGVSSVGMKEEDYTRITYDLTLNMARALASRNPDMTFCYVSGAGTDSTEQGRSMWARVKGRTENHLLQLPFRQAYMFRPGYIQPTPGLKNTYRAYKMLGFLYPLFKLFLGRYVTTLKEIGLAMIHAVQKGYDKPVLECPDIVKLAGNA
ncbi:MAG: NAD-dependent epimerase/dehydratase family protein [Saprospirales bacterium]|nr:NAD-dependent epimerase/dehydratase family protein [Saprospirales bacterium]